MPPPPASSYNVRHLDVVYELSIRSPFLRERGAGIAKSNMYSQKASVSTRVDCLSKKLNKVNGCCKAVYTWMVKKKEIPKKTKKITSKYFLDLENLL